MANIPRWQQDVARHGGPRDGDQRRVSEPVNVHDEYIDGFDYRYVSVRGGTFFGDREIELNMRFSARIDRRRPVQEPGINDRWNCE